MWISRAQYDYLQESNSSLRRDSDALKSILSAIDRTEDGKVVLGDVVVMSYDVWNDINAKWQAGKDAMMKVAAERDWYKQKYAELVVTSGMKG